MNTNSSKKLSVIIPCRNEEKFISGCLESIISNDFPKERLEVLVIDGMSDDGTRKIVKRYSKNYYFIKLLNNPKRITPVALNVGIKESIGDYILIIGGHSKLSKIFLSKNVESLKNFDADCVGGIIKTLPARDTLIARSIALALSHPFGVGNAYFRIGSKEKKYVDTVPFGCYRREIFKKIGFFDEELIRNQDDEFNHRLVKNGGKVLLVPDIVSYYFARDSLSKLWRMYFQYGYFKPLVAKKVSAVLTFRQIIPAIFVGTLFTSILFAFMLTPFELLFYFIMSLYLFVNIILSITVVPKKSFKNIFILIISFSTLHFSYGSGYLSGLLYLLIIKKKRDHKIKNMSLSR